MECSLFDKTLEPAAPITERCDMSCVQTCVTRGFGDVSNPQCSLNWQINTFGLFL